MFISTIERMEISQRLHFLEEKLKHMQLKINALEVIQRDSVVINKRVLLSQAEKLIHQKEKQREYSRRYHAKIKAQKAAQ